MKTRTLFTLIIGTSLTFFFSCSSVSLNENARNHVAILKDPSAGVNVSTVNAIADALNQEGFEVTFLSAKEVCDPSVLKEEAYFLYVIPNTRAYPEQGEEALRNYVQHKGNLLILGTPDLPGQPLLETVSPTYKMYPMHNITSLKTHDNQGVTSIQNINLPIPKTASSCFRRPTGKGFECGYSYRWIPLITAHDKDGLERGTAAWMLVNQAPIPQNAVFKDALRRLVATTQGNEEKKQLNVEGSVFAVCAINDPEALKKLANTPLFGDMAKRISEGVYLSHAGVQEFSYWQGETIKIGVAVVNYGVKTAKVDAIIRMTSKTHKEVVFEKNESFKVKPGETLKIAFGEIVAVFESGGYQITTELISDGEVIDIISYEVGILSSKKEPQDAFVTVKGQDFWLNGKKWYPVGVNYWPRSAIASEQVDYLYHWLTPGYYDPEQVDDDLQRLQDMGANFVAIRANYINDRRSVLDFLRRCHNHNIFVYLLLQTHKITVEPHYFEGIMMPFHFQKEMVTEFIEETHISNNPALFAWDLIWEPSNWLFKDSVTMFGWNGNPNFRQRWDNDWTEWINERYGSLPNAEADWGVPVPKTTEGVATSPSSKQFEEDGSWRIMVAAYRRFMGDLMNRQYNDACRTLRQLDPNHLISYRQGNLPPTDYTLISTLKHVDFFSMEAYSFPPKENGANKVGFVNRYLSYALEDKPFMWNEYGYGGLWGEHTRHLDGEDIEYQFEYVDMINREAYKNGASGIAPWWFAGGLRASEKTDFGITSPEGTLRPSGESVKRYGELYRTSPPSRPIPDKWFSLDLDAHSGGLWYVTNNNGAAAYEKATGEGKILGIRTSGTETTSVNTPLLAVGNTKYNGKNPPKYLNAEFNWFKVKIRDGEWIEITKNDTINIPANTTIYALASVGNLQEATWLTPENSDGNPGAVYLSTTENSGLQFKKAIDKDTPWYQDVDFEGSFLLTNGISKDIQVKIQMTAEGRAWFGEKLEFTLVLKD